MREGTMFKGVIEAAHSWQACREAGRVQMHNMWESVLFEELVDDPYIHLPQVEAGGRSDTIFLVTTRTEMARRAAVFI